MAEWTRAARVGAFAIFATSAGLGAWRFVSRATGTTGGYVVYAELNDAIGLAPQSRVLMAGIPVGSIHSIRLERGLARVDIKLMPGVALHEDAAVGKRSASLLGEYYLQLAPGTDGLRKLEDGERIAHVLESPTTDQIMTDLARIADRVKLVAENLASTVGSPEGEADMRATLRNLAEVTEALNQTVRENRETIQRTLLNVEAISDNSGPEISRILENVRVVTEEVRHLLADSSGDVKGSLGQVRDTLERVHRASGKLESALGHIDSVSARIDRGEGTIGRLTKDESLVDEIQGVAEGVGDFVENVQRLQTIVGLRSDYNVYAGTIKSYVELRLQPSEDKYYLVEVIKDPRGYTTFEQLDVDTTDPSRPSHYREVRTITTSSFRFSLMFAKRLGNFTGRFGIKESTGGIGLDTHLFDDRIEIRQDLFGFGEQLSPRWRIDLGYQVVPRLWLLGGMDDLLNPDRRDYFFGLQLRFNDEDLKAILPFTPMP